MLKFCFLLFIIIISYNANGQQHNSVPIFIDSTRIQALHGNREVLDSVLMQVTVVIKVSVDRNGDVVTAQFVKEKSTTEDEELIEQAKLAALKAKFTKSSTAPALQSGNICYKFTVLKPKIK